MSLPFGQVELIKAVCEVNPNTAVVMIASAPYDLTELEPVMTALVWGWFNGSESGHAMADVLFGNVNPSGKLPFTMPVKLEDSPAHALGAYPGENMTVDYKEGILVGYRWFDTKNIEPLYCFGHGLSYTDFSCYSFKSDKKVYGHDEIVQLSCVVKNTGERTGAETIQVYMHDPEASVMRPTKELKGFEKFFLKTGQKETVQISIPVKDLAFYNDRTMSWEVEPGQYHFLFGTSSVEIYGHVVIVVK
jgi:beta-glucosidase